MPFRNLKTVLCSIYDENAEEIKEAKRTAVW